MGWLKDNYVNIGLLIITIILCFLLIEFGFRVYHFITFNNALERAYDNVELPSFNSTVSLGEMIRPSPYGNIVYELKPNLSVIFVNEISGFVSTNSQGWREEEIDYNKDDKLRILGIGDSYMFGWSVKRKERYMDVLEKKLNENYQDKEWETIVFAVPGYSLFQEVEVLKRYGLQYKPDIIIYGFVHNDMCLPNWIVQKHGFFSRQSVFLSYLKDYSEPSIQLHYKHKGTQIWRICDPKQVPNEYKKFIGNDIFNKYLNELKKIGENNDIPIIVLYHDSLPKKIEGIYYVDGQVNNMTISKSDLHPSLEGHEHIADQIYTFLVEEDLIDELIK